MAKDNPKKLYRNAKNKMIAGICAGMADYFNIDPTVMRIIWIIATVLTGFIFGIIAYIVCILVIPEK